MSMYVSDDADGSAAALTDDSTVRSISSTSEVALFDTDLVALVGFEGVGAFDDDLGSFAATFFLGLAMLTRVKALSYPALSFMVRI